MVLMVFGDEVFCRLAGQCYVQDVLQVVSGRCARRCAPVVQGDIVELSWKHVCNVRR